MGRRGRGTEPSGCGFWCDPNSSVETEAFGLGSLRVVPVPAGHREDGEIAPRLRGDLAGSPDELEAGVGVGEWFQ